MKKVESPKPKVDKSKLRLDLVKLKSGSDFDKGELAIHAEETQRVSASFFYPLK